MRGWVLVRVRCWGMARDLQLADAGLVDLGEHTAGAGDLGVHHQTVDGVHGAGGAASIIEHLIHLVDGVLLGPRANLSAESIVIGNTVLDLKETGIGLQVGTLHHIAQDAIELVVARRR